MNDFYCCEKNDFTMFLETSAPNSRFIYFKGYLHEPLVGRALGKEIYRLAKKGVIYLVRRRSYEYIGFEYIAIKASKKPVLSLVPFSDEKLAELGKV